MSLANVARRLLAAAETHAGPLPIAAPTEQASPEVAYDLASIGLRLGPSPGPGRLAPTGRGWEWRP